MGTSYPCLRSGRQSGVLSTKLRTGVEAKVCPYCQQNFIQIDTTKIWTDFREIEVTERELQLQEAARELGKPRIAVALESAAAVARAEAVSVVASDIRETARDKNMKRMIKHCLENLIGRTYMKCMIKLPKSLTCILVSIAFKIPGISAALP